MQIEFDIWVIKIIDKFYQNAPDLQNSDNKEAAKLV